MRGSAYRGGSGPNDLCPLDRSPMTASIHPAGEPLRRCSSCGGVWIPEDGLGKILRWAENTPLDPDAVQRSPLTLASEMGRQKTRSTLLCPSCGDELIAEERGSHSYVLVDVCPAGCGTWLDDQELEQLMTFVRHRYGR